MAYLNGKKITLNPKFLGISDLTQLYKYLGASVEKEDNTPATIEDVVSLIEEINNVGIENLALKKVFPAPGITQEGVQPINTLQIMKAIEEISQAVLVDHTVTFMVENEPYEVVSVKNGNYVNEPTKPKKDGCAFIGWNDSEGNTVSFPITPTTDIVFLADLQPSLAYYFVTALGIDYNIYPHVIIFTREIGEDLRAFIYICSNMPIGDGREYYVQTPGEHYYQEHIVISWETDVTDVRSVIDSILDVKPTLTTRTGGGATLSDNSFVTVDFDGRGDNVTLFV